MCWLVKYVCLAVNFCWLLLGNYHMSATHFDGFQLFCFLYQIFSSRYHYHNNIDFISAMSCCHWCNVWIACECTFLISVLFCFVFFWCNQVQQAANLRSVDPLIYCNETSADFKVRVVQAVTWWQHMKVGLSQRSCSTSDPVTTILVCTQPPKSPQPSIPLG